MTTDITSQVQKQIEYYLSDKNLQHDTFFYEKITSNPEGVIDVDLFLNCNNIKKITTSKEEIIKAIKHSKEVVLTDNDKFVKRTKTALPNFLGRKHKKDELISGESKIKTEEVKEPIQGTDNLNYQIENLDPIILYITSDKDKVAKWKDLQKKITIQIKENYDLVYIRFSYQKGHAAVFKKAKQSSGELDLKEDTSKSIEFSFAIDEVNFVVRPANDEELRAFWKEHGSHYEFCIQTKLDELKGRQNKFQKRDNKNILKVPVTLGSEIFTEHGKIKAKARNIFYSEEATKNDVLEITDKDEKAFLVDLFKYVDENIDENAKICIEKQNTFTHGKSYFAYKPGCKRETISYLNACLRLQIANRKLKK